MLLPAITGTGLAEFVTERFADPATCTLAIALLLPPFGSPVLDETESVCVMVVPFATAVPTVTVKIKFAVVLAAIGAVSEQVRPVHVQPAGPVNDTSVVPVGSVSVNTGAFAANGPLLVTLCV
jgi:hypothetical protein